ncbi:hypothetical protein A2949_00610 [Candidatus Adlerbacteria bacterium RIFCSPLOWO2_01_FULL_54_21b]|uniref:Restriction endonuclease n=1 Tax=Candidatus Adlerbacteria bacterium RIFCSPLOWO2_01_FULL_54_21b TaxID=1797245 RepID=A0A1F4XZR3_9BACT|nr:MAG: hypothetical protein A2949_00610 [Candidatus Adlerbacteria bacterium RIFCSPLOWO2_01_FULL_54_21b]
MRKIYSKIKDLIRKVRDGLFLASSRSYAEQYIEPFVREKYELSDPESNDHDGVDKDGKRYEIKASKVLRATSNSKKLKTILDRILFETENVETNRLIPFSECKTAKYLANIQNVKRDHFDYLLYVLLFEDCVKIFTAKKEEIGTGIFPSWSDKHGRYDAHGKSGQFPVTRSTIQWHLDNHLKDTVSYEEMKDVYSKLSP